MTPKEKAKQLVDKFYSCPLYSRNEAKRCVLVCADEIIAENKLFPYNTIFYERVQFWKDVKLEIEKL